MPEICRFNGITIDMYAFDTDRHKSPHIHVFYRDAKYVYGLDGEVIEKKGNIPGKQRREIQEWIFARQIHLLEDWDRAIQGLPIYKIDPL